MKITLVGMGSGAPGSLTAAGLEALRGAELIIGARRLLENLPEGCTANRAALYKTDEICALLRQTDCAEAAVAFSGDTGFYSGAAALCRALDDAGLPYTVLPGVSSVQLLAAALGRPWQGWRLVSAHGCACDPVAACRAGGTTFFLTGGSETPATLCQQLAAAGLGDAAATVGENLGTPSQRLVTGTAQELAAQRFAPLSVLLVENVPAPLRRTPGLPDAAFIRGKTPMTKQEVRAAALAKLAVRPGDTLWDVGAGTGSVSVELALAAPAGRVCAVAPYRGPCPRRTGRLARAGRCFYRRQQGQSAGCRRCRAGREPRCTALYQRHCAGNLTGGRCGPDGSRPDRPGHTNRSQPQPGGGQPAPAHGEQPGFLDREGVKMLQLVLAAPRSGSGKTTAACALLAALTARGLTPCAFKSGPDYIDPMFHRAVLGVESHNLDLFFSAPQTARALYARHAAGHGAAVVEGAMGYYDGLGGVTDTASAWQLADTLDLPALLVVRPKGASLTLAAELRGLTAFRTPHHIAGILLNDCTQGLCALLKPMLEKETGLPVVGCLPPLPEAAIESRHLGLKTAAEIDDLQHKIQLLSDAAQQTIDWPLLHTLFDRPAPAAVPCTVPPPRVRLAVARDAAFCFTYAETLEALRENGAELCFFSPLADTSLPVNIGGLYLPGGYPELYAARLAANAPLRAAVKSAVQGGLPTVAECGGFLYLGRTLQDADGTPHPMAGVLPGQGFKVGRLVRFGYARLTARADSMLFRAGETLPVHEFHHWDSTQNGDAFTAAKANGRQWACGFANERLYAGFPHLYWAGTPLPKRFAAAAEHYIKETS